MSVHVPSHICSDLLGGEKKTIEENKKKQYVHFFLCVYVVLCGTSCLFFYFSFLSHFFNRISFSFGFVFFFFRFVWDFQRRYVSGSSLFLQALDEFIFGCEYLKIRRCVITHFQCKCTWNICARPYLPYIQLHFFAFIARVSSFFFVLLLSLSFSLALFSIALLKRKL